MADKALSSLTTVASLDTGDKIYAVVDGNSRQVPVGGLPFALSAVQRARLTADTTYTVDTGAGIDTGTSGPFRTLQYAWNNVCANIDLAGFDVTLDMTDGTYVGLTDDTTTFNGDVRYSGGGRVIINGNAASPGNVIVTAGATGWSLHVVNNFLFLQNLEMRSTGSGGCLGVALSGVVYFGPGLRFGTTTNEHIHASSGGQVHTAAQAYSVVGGATAHLASSEGGQIRINDSTITLVGTPAFSEAFAVSGVQGLIDAQRMTFSGSATGPRFVVGRRGTIITDTGDLPGNAAGTIDVGGQYNDSFGPFDFIDVGHASDTTVTRASAGSLAIEGNIVYRAGGTDVPVTDGGTGASDASTARTNLGVGTGDSPQFTAVNVGNASDTTLSRFASGIVAVEGINLPSVFFSCLTTDRTGSDVNTAQAVFGTGEDAVTLAASTSYFFEASYMITRAAGITSHTCSVIFGGTATFTSIAYQMLSSLASNFTGEGVAYQTIHQVATAQTISAGGATAEASEEYRVFMKGIMRINAGGTVIPQFQFSAAPGGAPTIEIGSYFKCWAAGSNTVASAGPWA